MCRIDRFLRNKNSREYFLVNRLSKDDSWNFQIYAKYLYFPIIIIVKLSKVIIKSYFVLINWIRSKNYHIVFLKIIFENFTLIKYIGILKCNDEDENFNFRDVSLTNIRRKMEERRW